MILGVGYSVKENYSLGVREKFLGYAEGAKMKNVENPWSNGMENLRYGYLTNLGLSLQILELAHLIARFSDDLSGTCENKKFEKFKN